MANVELEQKTPLAPPQEGEAQTASVALCEENLAALLRAVTAPTDPAPTPEVAAVMPTPAAVLPEEVPAAMPVLEVVTEAASEENVLSEAVAPEAAQRPEALTSAVALPEENLALSNTTPVVAIETLPMAPSQPVAEPQQDVHSKLALISSIKQRRAITTRVEVNSPVAEPAIPTPAKPEAVSSVSSQQVSEPVAAPAAPASVPQEGQPTAKRALPPKKVWSSSPAVARREESRTNSVQTAAPVVPAPQPIAAEPVVAPVAADPVPEAPAAMPAPKPAAAIPPARPATPKPEPVASPMFASIEAHRENEPTHKLKGFLTSKTGMGTIGGVVVGAALTAFLIMGHGSKPGANAAKSASTEPAHVVNDAVAPVVPPVTSSSKEAPNKSLAAATSNTNSRSDDKSNAKPETAQAAKSAAAPAPPISQPQATAEPARTVARTFAPPAPAARPVNNTIVDAPPVLVTSTTIPGVVALPARIAPLPPPPAPRATTAPATAANPTQPRQISIAGKIQAARLTRQVLPAYPALAKTARVQGTVRFRATIGTDGQVKGLTTLGGPLPLAQSAADAVRQWRYQPTVVDGQPVEVVTEIDVAFAL